MAYFVSSSPTPGIPGILHASVGSAIGASLGNAFAFEWFLDKYNCMERLPRRTGIEIRP
jgi:hypothetical protein